MVYQVPSPVNRTVELRILFLHYCHGYAKTQDTVQYISDLRMFLMASFIFLCTHNFLVNRAAMTDCRQLFFIHSRIDQNSIQVQWGSYRIYIVMFWQYD